jgi:hypothetical protein
MRINKTGGIILASSKTKRGESMSKLLKPSSRSLFETIESLLEFADKVLVGFKTWRLFHVHYFIEFTLFTSSC